MDENNTYDHQPDPESTPWHSLTASEVLEHLKVQGKRSIHCGSGGTSQALRPQPTG